MLRQICFQLLAKRRIRDARREAFDEREARPRAAPEPWPHVAVRDIALLFRLDDAALEPLAARRQCVEELARQRCDELPRRPRLPDQRLSRLAREILVDLQIQRRTALALRHELERLAAPRLE